mmetsp:Transcript_14583/g.36280  ORF Transcript_14583/g.36280 Transcript_14583/m.36280 type:complete len:80 (+) Transcript_14583:453-692(+)
METYQALLSTGVVPMSGLAAAEARIVAREERLPAMRQLLHDARCVRKRERGQQEEQREGTGSKMEGAQGHANATRGRAE